MPAKDWDSRFDDGVDSEDGGSPRRRRWARVVLRPLARRPLASCIVLGWAGLAVVATVNALALQRERHPAPLFVQDELPAGATFSPAGGELAQPLPALRPDATPGEPRAEPGEAGIILPRPRPGSDAPAPASTRDPIAEAIEQAAVAGDQQAAARSAEPEQAPERALVHALQEALAAAGYYDGLVEGEPNPDTVAAIRAFERDEGLPETGTMSFATLEKLRSSEASGAVASLDGETGRIRAVQEVLADLGYAPGAVDGRMNDELRAAIRRFEADRNLPISGRISDKLLEELRSVTDLDMG